MEKAHFLLSKAKALEQYAFAKTLADIVSYSSKTNPEVTPILENETDSQFNIHTLYEWKRIKDKAKVYFLAQALTNEDLENLFSQGVKRIIIDNEADLNMLIDYIEKNNIEIELFLRTKLKENSIKTERYFVFGLNSSFVNTKIKELKNHPQIKSISIHFHRKTQNMAEWNIISEIDDMFDKETLDIIEILDIGGGLPSTYANTNAKVFDSIYKRIKEIKVWLNDREIKLMIEPGRFICAPSVKLITYVKAVYENNIIVDASVYNSDTDAFTVPTKLLVENELDSKNEHAKPFVIKGFTPCSMDLFRYKVYLKKPNVGDIITFINAGAYNFYCDFCDLEKLPTKIIDTFED